MLRRGYNTAGRFSQSWVILLLLSGISFLIYIFQKKKTSLIPNSTVWPEVREKVYLLLKNAGMNETLSRYATAQAAHETANFTSAIYKSNNNLFGMKYAKQLQAQGEKNGYAYYFSIENSVIDFVAWYNRHRNNILSLPLIITSLTGYVSFMKNQKYFEADEAEYLKGCEYFYNKFFTQ